MLSKCKLANMTRQGVQTGLKRINSFVVASRLSKQILKNVQFEILIMITRVNVNGLVFQIRTTLSALHR